MREDGCTNLVVTGQGSFRARLTRIALHRLRLVTAEEFLARISFFSVPRRCDAAYRLHSAMSSL